MTITSPTRAELDSTPASAADHPPAGTAQSVIDWVERTARSPARTRLSGATGRRTNSTN